MKNSNELLKAAKHEKAKRLARSSFWHFRLYIHKKLKVGAWQRDACYALQQFYEDYKKGLRPQLVIQAPPQHGKSVIVNDFIIWVMGKDSENDEVELKIIYAAFSDALSTRGNRRIQRFTATLNFNDLFPNYRTVSPVNQNLIGFGDDGFFRNTTTNGPITGETMDLGIIDDPTKGREAANSPTIREKTWDWFTSDFITRFSDNGAFLCILTRWHVDDLIGRLLNEDATVVQKAYKAISKDGYALFPEHKSLDFLKKRKKIMPQATWNSLYQQNPTIAEGNFFKPDLIPIVDVLPPDLKQVRVWDLAATENGGDFTVGMRFGYDKKQTKSYVFDVVRGQFSPEDVEKIVLKTAKQDGKKCHILIPQDPGQAGKAQARNFARILKGFSFTIETVNGDKVTRASPAAAQLNMGNISILRAFWNRVFIEELRLFPNGVNDDQVDTLSDSYNHFTKERKRGLM